jgi:peptidoglycan/xylan/chitin deacetylase (PgdA/CDA1 family)
MRYARLKIAFLYGCKAFGLFWLSRRLTTQGVRILCYHGFATDDSSAFRPKLFIDVDKFEKRLEFLAKARFPITRLEDALSALERGTAANGLTVITIDDGFQNVQHAWQLLRRVGFPATVYITSYYCVKESPIFRLGVQYLFWKTDSAFLSASSLLPMFPDGHRWNNSEERDETAWKIIEHGEGLESESERWTILEHLSDSLGIDVSQFLEPRKFGLLNTREISKLALEGLDVQLHTHRHRELTNDALVQAEISDNRAVLEPLIGRELRHFCYPSGIWSRSLWPALEAVKVQSAVTCEPGLNYGNTPRLAMHRFLDGEDISQIEFEAEMMGLSELLRRVRSAAKKRLSFRHG